MVRPTEPRLADAASFEIVPPEILERPRRDEAPRLDRDRCAVLLDQYLRRLGSQAGRGERWVGLPPSSYGGNRITPSGSRVSTTMRANVSACPGESSRIVGVSHERSRYCQRSPPRSTEAPSRGLSCGCWFPSRVKRQSTRGWRSQRGARFALWRPSSATRTRRCGWKTGRSFRRRPLTRRPLPLTPARVQVVSSDAGGRWSTEHAANGVSRRRSELPSSAPATAPSAACRRHAASAPCRL